ncbi:MULTISPECIES: hypothetical protein [unclassified Embleya]|uniref:hypothetical protein n=2 Tax=Embleya TaxID=2699295 RepID=UPI0033F25F5E
MRWDGATITAATGVAPNGGGFTVRLVVPKDASKGSHRVSAYCGQADASAPFEVTTGTGPASSRKPTPTSSSTAVGGTGAGAGSGWMIGMIAGGGLLVAALAGYLGIFRRGRGPRWTRRHVRAVIRPGPAAAGVQDVRDTHGTNRTVRLEPRADPGEQTIEEPDP